MASTPVSFELVKEIWDEHIKIRTYYFYDTGTKSRFTYRGELMPMTFEDIAKIEVLRRNIENLQVMLSKQATMRFGVLDEQNRRWDAVGTDLDPVLRETLCKYTVVQITKLLDESARLGVDVSAPKEVLLKFLEEIKPKQEV